MKRFTPRWSMARETLSIAVLALVALGHDALSASATSPYVPSDAERARWTMSDMRSLATALEAFATDNHAYPSAARFEVLIPLIQPSYMRKAPATDAWGHAYVYVPSQDGRSYRLVSAGSDGVTNPGTWTVTGSLSSFGEDAVLDSGSIVRPWPFQ